MGIYICQMYFRRNRTINGHHENKFMRVFTYSTTEISDS